MKREWPHYSDVDPREWRWPNFSPAELACRGTGKLMIDTDALERLQSLRRRLGAPMIVNSAYRSPEHNRRVGGAKRSKHLEAIAFDVSMANLDPEAFEDAARAEGFTGFGFYPPNAGRPHGFVHIDTSTPREWGKRWHVEQRFAAEPVPPRASDAAKATAGGAAGAVVAESALREVAPFLPAPWGDYAMIAAVALPIAIGLGIATWRYFGRRSAEVV